MTKRIRAKVDHLKELREKAEARLRNTDANALEMDRHDLEKLVHELGVYHIELEMQNEELNAVQDTLLESREKYYRLFDFAPVAFFHLDEDGVILEANRAGLGFLGLSGRDLASVKPFGIYVHPDDRHAFRSLIKGASKAEYNISDVLRITGKGGRVMTLQVAATQLDTHDGRPAVMLAASDITPLVAAEAAREEAKDEARAAREEAEALRVQRLENLRVLAGGIAHDLNNLMVAVQANTELAITELDPGSTAAEYVRGIDAAASRVSGLARQILSYTGKEQAVKELLDLNAVARDTAGLLIAAMPKNAKLEYNYADDALVVEADYQNIQQVMMNLIINAGDALQGNPGDITISTGTIDADQDYMAAVRSQERLAPGKYFFFEVSDTGSGMSPETKDRIFEAFYTTKAGGRGLGMSVVTRIAGSLGGGLVIKSEPGRGTMVRLLIPMPVKAVTPASAAKASCETLAGSGTVLVVDDEPSILYLMEKILRNAGYNVLSAADGEEGVKVFRDHAEDIAVVVMDLIMPRMHGDRSAREIRKIRGDAPIVLLSGYHELEIEDLMEGPGKTRVLNKPCRSRELLCALQDITAT